jgi:hypothetical protein
VTSNLLHLPAGPAVLARDEKVARVPEDFAWIHDVQQALRAAGAAPAGVAARA